MHATGERDWNLRAYPVNAFKAIEQQQLEGRRLFTTDAWGGYVIATAWPAQKVFFDDRYDMYPIGLNRDYGTIANLDPGWVQMLDRYNVEVVMSPRKTACSPRGSPSARIGSASTATTWQWSTPAA